MYLCNKSATRMKSATGMNYRTVFLVYLHIAKIWTAPLKIIQAQPQVMMHNLQQPSPMETLQALKAQKINQDLQTTTKLQQMIITNLQQQMATNTLQKLAKIQAMQYATPSPIEMHPLDLMQSWLPQMPVNIPWSQDDDQQDMPLLHMPVEQQQSVMPMIQQMSEEAMQEIALQQQMLSLQQMQAFNQLNTVHSPFTLPQPEPIIILLPEDEKENLDNELFKNTNQTGPKQEGHTNQGHEDEELEAVVVDSSNDTDPEVLKGMKKAIILIPNARISIGGIISQIPWLPIEVNVPDTAIWAWNGIYNGISSIISGIGNRLPWRPKPQKPDAPASDPSGKTFLKLLNNNYGQALPVY